MLALNDLERLNGNVPFQNSHIIQRDVNECTNSKHFPGVEGKGDTETTHGLGQSQTPSTGVVLGVKSEAVSSGSSVCSPCVPRSSKHSQGLPSANSQEMNGAGQALPSRSLEPGRVDEVRGSQYRVMRRLRVGWGQGPGLTPELKGQRVDQEAGAGRNTQEGLAAGLCTAMKGIMETGTVRRADRTSSQGSQYDVQTKEPAKRL